MKTYSNYLLLIIAICFNQNLFAQVSSAWQIQEREIPDARFNHSMVEINDTVYLFGGVTETKENALNDLWGYFEGNNTWTEKHPANPPSTRKYHGAVKKNGKMYILGGDTFYGVIMDVWEYDPETNIWTEKPSSSSQKPKLYFKATAGDNKIWVTGGFDFTVMQATPATWGYDLSTGTWTEGADCPSPRYGHTTFFKDGKLVVCAGRRGTELLNDMWQYDVAANIWTEITPQGAPEKVEFAAFDFNSEVLWMAGGTNVDQSGNSVDSKSTWEYNYADNNWSQKTDGPAFTDGAAAFITVSSSSYSVLVFGGSKDGTALNDTWIYNSETGWGIVGISENEIGNTSGSVNVYPALSQGHYHISAKKKIQKLMVFDMQGRLIEKQEVNNMNIDIDLSANKAGIYFIKVLCNNHYSTKKIVLQGTNY